jgi:CheY-like chemotaxis protein
MSAAGGLGCVLVVDDEEDIRETLREAIEMVGCKAITAANGAEALQLLETQRPCLIVVDLFMPVMTGPEMLAAMRERPHLVGLRVVISTSTPSRAPTGIPVIPKPIDIDKLWEHLRQSCRCNQTRAL